MSTNLIGQENLPNVYIKNISLEKSGNKLNITSKVCLYDTPSGGWYSDHDLKSNMKILIVLSSDNTFNQTIVTGRASLTPQNLKFIQGYDRQRVHHKIYSISQVNRQAFKNVLENGHVVFPYKCTFRTKKADNLSLFAVCYLDTRQFSSQNDLELSTRNVNLYHGAIVGEQIFVNGQLPTVTNVFMDSSGTAHTGPVHINGGNFIPGSKSSGATTPQLTLSSVNNTKIKDYRMTFKTKMRNKVKMKNKPVMSDLYCSVDRDGTVRASFDMNMENMFLRSSAYAKLLMALDTNLFNAAVKHIAISDLSIYSQKVIEKMRSTNMGTRKMVPVPVGHRKKVIGSKESSKRRGLAPEDLRGASIKELDINYGTMQNISPTTRSHRTVCFSQQNNRYTRGKSLYSVEVSYKDPSEKILLNMITEAVSASGMLANYRQRVKRITNYNYHADQTKPNLYNRMADSIWLDPLSQFMFMYELMFDTSDVDTEALMSNLIIMIHPKTLTMKSLDWFCEKYSFVLNRLTKYFSEIKQSMTPDVKLGYVQSDKDRGKVLFIKKFDKLIDLSSYRISTSFVPETISKKIEEDSVFPILSYGNIRSMARSERLRFFGQDPVFTPQMVPHIKELMLDKLNNLDYSSYTFFSPSAVSMGQRNVVDLSNLETINLDLFNKIYNIRRDNTHPVGMTPSHRRQKDTKEGRRSSFYVKETRRESEEVEEYKSSEENLGKESVFIDPQTEETKVDTPSLDEKTKNKFKSYDRAKESDYKISFEDFNLRNQHNILSDISSKKLDDPAMKRVLRDLPLHLKALLGSEYGFTKNNIFYGHEDLLQEPTVADLVKTCFLSLVKIQYLEDYRNNNYKDSQWRDLTSYSFNSLIVRGEKTVMCRFVPHDDATLKLSLELFEKMGIENKYFLISKTNEANRLRPKGKAYRSSSGELIVDTLQANNKRSQIIKGFLNNTAMKMGVSGVSCRSLVINQPSSKDGPLRNINYKEANDLVGGAGLGSPTMTTSTTTTSTAMSSTPSTMNTTQGSGGSY